MKTKGKRKTRKTRKTRKQRGGELPPTSTTIDLLPIIDNLWTNNLDNVIKIVDRDINISDNSSIREKYLEFLRKIKELKEIQNDYGEEIKEMHNMSFNTNQEVLDSSEILRKKMHNMRFNTNKVLGANEIPRKGRSIQV